MWQLLILEVLQMHAIIVVNVLTIRAGIHMRTKSCVNLKVKTNIKLKFRYDVHSDWFKKRALLEYKTRSKSCHIICHQLYINIICILIYTVCIQIHRIFHSFHFTIAFNALIAFVLNNQSNLAHSKKECDCG